MLLKSIFLKSLLKQKGMNAILKRQVPNGFRCMLVILQLVLGIMLLILNKQRNSLKLRNLSSDNFAIQESMVEKCGILQEHLFAMTFISLHLYVAITIQYRFIL